MRICSRICPARRTMLIALLWLAGIVGALKTMPAQVVPGVPAPAATSVIDLDAQGLKLTQVDSNWRFHAGDDARWALRDFDDTKWEVIQPRKDWTRQDYSAAEELAWFRFRLRVPAKMPAVVLQLPRIWRNYQLFADGHLIGQVGRLPPEDAPIVTPAGRLFTVPLPAVSGAGSREVQIALRLWQEAKYANVRPNVMSGRAIAGDPASLNNLFNISKRSTLLSYGSDYTQDIIGVIVGGAALLLFYLTRQRFYLWFAASIAINSVQLPFRLASEHFALTFLGNVLGYMLMDLFVLFAMTMFLLGTLQIRGWTSRIIVAVLGILGESGPLLLLLAGLPQIWADGMYLVFVTAAQGVLVGYLIRGWRRGNIDAKLLLFPYLISVVFGSLDNLGHSLVDFNVPHGGDLISSQLILFTEPFRVNFNDVGNLVSLVGLLAVLVLRFAQTSREQQRLASALQAAHDIQHRLVPVDIPSLGGLQTSIVYLAAEEVGGDFCQVLPRPDGSILVAIGDVSGKGLQAAMLGTVAVGALRAMTNENVSPALVLERLNKVLLRTENSGFITCLCLVLDDAGEVTLANAGHLSPYLNGQEVAVAAGLPLGIALDLEYEQSSFQLPAKARLTLLSDGVVEARSHSGELFGFDRTSQISQLPASAIAAKAHAFGQEDDITIITLDWSAPVAEFAPA